MRVAALFLVLAGVFGPAGLCAQPPGVAFAGAPHRPLTLKQLPRNLIRDQKFLWRRPFRIKRADASWAALFGGTTAGLLATDKRVGQELSNTPPGSGYAYSRRVGQLGSGFTDFGIAGTFYLVGRACRDERARATGLLGVQALSDTLIVIHTLKTVTQRPRPTHADGRTRIHNADGQFFSGGRSFPSGHAGNAWALATVVAHQYRHRRWVPPTAYSLAGLVAVSRVGQRRHFPADVFVGSALGYLIGRHVSRTYARPQEPAETARRAVPQMTLEVPVGGGTAFLLRWDF